MQRRVGGLQDVLTLFDSGTTVGMTDGELLGRFAERPDRTGADPDAAVPAFAALVQRHGPMVLRVCRSILRDEHDAQDAFQATFLVLVRRARAVRRRGSVGSWLHGVALRVSARARADLTRRRRHERRVGEARIAADRSDNEEMSPETAAIIHEELGRLPERYRMAVVLCYLEGHTCEAAARRLGWPVGTVKSRLARGRERLRGRLIRRGLAPDEASSLPTPAGVIPAALSRDTIEGMLRFAAGRPTAGITSATALSWTCRTLRTMQMTRLALFSALLMVGFASGVAAMWTTPHQKPSPSRSEQPSEPAESGKKAVRLNVRVVDTQGRGVPDAEVRVREFDPVPIDDESGPRTITYRTDADGRFWISVDVRYERLIFEVSPDDRTLGWGNYSSANAWLKDNSKYPITLTLLPRNHEVQGTIVDTRGRPIGGVHIRAMQFNHDENGVAMDPRPFEGESWLASAVTDETGRYRLALPEATSALLGAYHPRYAGPWFTCSAEDRIVPPVTMEDAGGIAGTVVDASTGRPVAGAAVGAQCIETTVMIRGVGWGRAVSDDQGHFRVGGLAPGVYNLLFASSPKGRRLTARAVEGVRVQAGREARTDLRMIEGRRLSGRAIFAVDGEPVAHTPILCYSASHPRSGGACQSTYTDDQGRFEHFVPPGPALVYINNGSGPDSTAQRIVKVPDDRDPEPVVLKRGSDPNARPAPPPRFIPPVECEVRVRVKTDPGDRPAPGADRTLTGRIFDKGGAPLPAVRIGWPSQREATGGTTDRQGLFRVKGVPLGEVRVGLYKDGEVDGVATVLPEAVEIDLIFP